MKSFSVTICNDDQAIDKSGNKALDTADRGRT